MFVKMFKGRYDSVIFQRIYLYFVSVNKVIVREIATGIFHEIFYFVDSMKEKLFVKNGFVINPY